MALALTAAELREMYLTRVNATQDTTIQKFIDAVIAEVIDYLDDTDITTSADFSEGVKLAVLEQAAYNYNNRDKLGLNAVSYPDGSVNKFATDEFLPAVKKNLERTKEFHFGTS